MGLAWKKYHISMPISLLYFLANSSTGCNTFIPSFIDFKESHHLVDSWIARRLLIESGAFKKVEETYME